MRVERLRNRQLGALLCLFLPLLGAAQAASQTTPAAAPAFTLAAGTYSSAQTVGITDTTPGAIVYFTVTGIVPASPSAAYAGPIAVLQTETINAFAIAPGYSRSATVSAAYTIAPQAAAPLFNVAAGTYISVQTVGITAATPGASIYYTITGILPPIPSQLYTGPVTISSSETIHAIALAPGYSRSPSVSASYTITLPAAAPQLTPPGGTYLAPQAVGIVNPTPGGQIFYTTDGTVPTASSRPYTAPIAVTASQTIRAVAIAPGYSQSAVAQGTFSIEGPLGISAPSALPPAYVGATYSAVIVASGQGPNYTWTVNGTPVATNGSPMAIGNGIAVASNGNYSLLIGGVPTSTGTVPLTAAVTDNYTGTQAGPVTVSIPVSFPVAPSLPAPNPPTLGLAVAHESYMGYLSVSGGVPPYSWTVSGLAGTMSASAGTPIATLAGNGLPGWSGDGGPATAAQIEDFGGIAVDAMGNVYFSDSISSRVRMITPAGTISTVAGTGTPGYNGDNMPAAQSQLNSPMGLAVDRAGNLFIADTANERIRVVSALTGQIATVAGTGTAGSSGDGLAATSAQLNAPAGVALDCQGNLYIADSGNARVREVVAMTGAMATVAGTGSAGFSGDGGAAINAQLNRPWAVAADSEGNIYVADLAGTTGASATDGRIREITVSGAIRTVAGIGPAGYNGDGIAAIEAALSNPAGIAIDASGNLLIADAGNNRIRMVTPAGIISTVAGAGSTTYNGDGIAAIGASLDNPQGVATDLAGNLYIADQNSRIRTVRAPSMNSILAITGTPSAPGTIAFQASVQDATGAAAGPVSYSINVTAPLPLSLPAPNPITLPSAVAGQPYSGSIVASGGVPNYAWSANGGQVAANGKAISLPGGITISANGGNTLSIGGTPTSAGAITLWVGVKDGMGHTSATVVYTIDVMSAPGSQVSGQVNFVNCGAPAAGVTVKLNTTPTQVISTDGNGQFEFENVPNGTFTLTPSVPAPESVFYPASETVTVNGGTVNGANFQAAIGYLVSGNVGYTDGIGGRIYLKLVNGSCPEATLGTSIPSAQGFYIRSVQPGVYTIQAWQDETGYGGMNAEDPAVTIPNLVVGSANLTNVSFSFVQPAPVTVASPPQILFGGGVSGGAVLGYQPILVNGVEQASSYTVQWSTSSSFATITGSRSMNACGSNGTAVWMLDSLPSRSVYYFRAQGVAGNSTGPWSGTFGPVTIGPASVGNTVSGTVTFSGPAGGILYVGFRDVVTGKAYVTWVLDPVSPQAYTLKVPTGSNYAMFAVIDENEDGLADNGDINGLNNDAVRAISGNTTVNVTLPASNAVRVTTQHLRLQGESGAEDSYSLAFDVFTPNLIPLAVTLESGPNVLAPMDIGNCLSCSAGPDNFWLNIGGAVPNVGDTYMVEIVDSIGRSNADPGWGVGPTVIVPAAVTGVVNAFASNLLPTDPGAGATPSFSWTDPPNASSYTYQFTLWDASGNLVWQIPSLDSQSAGFSSAVTSIAWGVDPTGSSNPPSVSSLAAGEQYFWEISAQDSNGNESTMQANFQP